MKTILACLAHLDRVDEIIEAAIHIARRHDGHVIGYYPIPGASLVVYAAPGGDFPVDDTLTRLYEGKLSEIKTKFEDRMRRSGVNYEWREDRRFETHLTKAILEHGRECDLIILGHDAPGSKYAGEEASFIGDVIMAAGRPVLVVPPFDKNSFKIDRIAIGWNATRESCRAAFDALPILVNAKDVFLAWVNPEKKSNNAGRLPGAELANALSRHDVKITVKGLSNRQRVAKALSDYVKEDNIDLLVIGAYGHSRLARADIRGCDASHAEEPVMSGFILKLIGACYDA